jgi:hypothetical protein
MNWIALFWLLSSIVGAVYTAKNLLRALDRHQALVAVKMRESAIITAFTHVRSNWIFMAMHASFIVAGLISFSQYPTGTPWPSRIENLISLLVVMAVPLGLIVLSETANRDDDRAMALERTSRGSS